MSVAKLTVFKLGSAAAPSTLIDLSSTLEEVKAGFDVNVMDTTTFGGNDKSFEGGLRETSVSLSGLWNPGVDGQMFALAGAPFVNFEYGPLGNAVGNPKYTGSAVLSKYEPPAKVGEVIKFSAELKTTGPVTRGTY